jgi:hypothetical protein
MLPEAMALVDILHQLAVYENDTKITPDKILRSLGLDVQTAFLHTTTALLVHRSLKAVMHTIQNPQLQRAPRGLIVVQVKGNFAGYCLHTCLSGVLAKDTKVHVHYHMEMARADYFSEHASDVLAKCDLQACERRVDQGVEPATGGVWANWARFCPEKRQRRTALHLTVKTAMQA